MGDQLRCLAVDRRSHISVEFGEISLLDRQRVAFDRIIGSGCHGFGNAHAGDDWLCVPVFPVRYHDDPAVLLPILNDRRAVFAENVPPGKLNKVAGAHFYDGDHAVLEGDGGGKAVVTFFVGHVGDGGKYGADLLACDPQELIQQMHAPIQDHAAAVCFPIPPIAGNAPGAVDS